MFQNKINLFGVLFWAGLILVSSSVSHADDMKFGLKASVDIGSYLNQKASNGTGSFLSDSTVGFRQISGELIGKNFIIGLGYNTGAKITGFQNGSGTQLNFSGNNSYSYIPLYLKYRFVMNQLFSAYAGLSYSLFNLDLNGTDLAAYSGASSYTVNRNLGYMAGLMFDFGSFYLDAAYEVDRGTITYQGGSNSGLTFPLEVSKIQISLGYLF